MPKPMIRIVTLLVAALLLAACGGGSSDSSTTSGADNDPGATTTAAPPSTGDFRIAMVLPGPINDQEFNSVGFRGLETAGETLGVETAFAENVTDTEAERVLRDFATSGYQLIIAHSFGFEDATVAVAADFPDAVFMHLATATAPNIGTYANPDYQGAYLSGMLAAGTSETGRIGWVSTLPIPSLLANLHAFEAGAREIDEGVEVSHAFIGSFFDPPKGQEAAQAIIETGADVVSAQTAGVIAAAEESDALAIGAITDQNHLAPDNVLTSIVWDLEPLITDVATEVMNSTWESQTYSYGIPEGSVLMAPFHGLDTKVPDDVMAAVDERFEQIKSGEFVVPFDTTEVD